MASGPASHVKPVTKQTFGRASPEAAREAAGEALPNGALYVGEESCHLGVTISFFFYEEAKVEACY